jgi:aminoglycoside 6'-N-acetyltransferase
VTAAGDRASVHEARVPLDGASVHLRPAGPGDAPAFAAILREPSVQHWWQTADAEADALDLTSGAEAELAVWAIEAGGGVVGLIQAHEETDRQYRHAGIDIVLAERGQDRGLGTDAVRTVARWLIGARGHHRLTIDPAAHNARAIATYAKVGFRPVGVMRRYEGDLDGSWHDGLLMDLLADELT